jgi:hypothetical protein
MATIEEQSSEYRSLFDAPRPRQVRIRTAPKILLGTLPIAAMLLIYFGILELLTFRELGANLTSIFYVVFNFFASPIMIAVSIVTFGRVRRDKKLLKNGELAVGTVTYQELVRGRKSTWSQVRYRFNDASGQLYQDTGRDYSRRLRVEMTVPVFYDAKDPETNVALCTASCRLKRSNG